MIKKTTSVVKDQFMVKIAVQLENAQNNQNPQLIVLDQRQPLIGKIQELCNNWNLADPEYYSLYFGELNKFVTEKNRNEIKNGSVLRLRYSPSKTTSDILDVLKSTNTITVVDRAKCLQKLSQLSLDLTFALEFIKEQGLELLINMIQDQKCDLQILCYSLKSFMEIMEHGTVSWEILDQDFINHNILITCQFKNYPNDCIECTLSNLENIVTNSTKYHQIEKDVTLEDLIKLIELTDSAVIKQNAIALINALFLKGDEARKKEITKTFSTRKYRSVILSNVVNINIGTELAHQLYVFQTLTLGLLEARMRTKMNASDQEAHEKIKELRKIAFEDYFGLIGNNTFNNDEAARRNTNINFSHYFKKLGFKSDINPAQDFIETPPGILALDCMIYFARNYTQQYTKIIHENSCRQDEFECPFGRTSIELVKLICDILHIGEPPLEQCVEYHTIFFTHDHPFEEFFCISVVTLNRTWKDMRATSEDFNKVLSVVREQIARTLRSRPGNFEDFRIKIGTLNYQTITALRQQERTSREECESTAPSIIALKEKIGPEIIDLIRQQRLNYLIEGTRFSKYSRGTRSKDKFWYARLSPNYKIIHYGDCDEKTVPFVEELPNKLNAIDIKQLLVGKECPHTKGRKSTANLGFSITFDNMEHATLDFVAPDEETFNIWTDGINALLNQEMTSKLKEKEFEMLLSMEIKLRLLDIEGIEIPTVPPPVLELPNNFDFCFEN